VVDYLVGNHKVETTVSEGELLSVSDHEGHYLAQAQGFSPLQGLIDHRRANVDAGVPTALAHDLAEEGHVATSPAADLQDLPAGIESCRLEQGREEGLWGQVHSEVVFCELLPFALGLACHINYPLCSRSLS
jgi:hypothetical protein